MHTLAGWLVRLKHSVPDNIHTIILHRSDATLLRQAKPKGIRDQQPSTCWHRHNEQPSHRSNWVLSFVHGSCKLSCGQRMSSAADGILHQFRMKPCKYWEKQPTNWRRILSTVDQLQLLSKDPKLKGFWAFFHQQHAGARPAELNSPRQPSQP